jgi:ribosomal-protein-alanine N-acetyltransferase
MTERVYLRPVCKADQREFLHSMKHSVALHHPWISPPTTDVLFDYYLARLRRDDHEGMLVCARDDHRIIGVININNIVRGSLLSGSLGYYASARDAGHGYMREGLTLIKRHAFRSLGLHRLEANIQPENTKSIAMVKACGFQFEGLSPRFLYINGAWRDHERWTAIDTRERLLAD